MEEQIYFETAQSGLIAGFSYKEILFDQATNYQQATLLETESFGKTLFLDQILNSAESDEFIYHESIVHPAMIRASQRDRVMIIGGAEGGVAREVLKYKDVSHTDMVDIDETLVSLCREHLTGIYGNPWDDPRLHVHHTDGRAFLEDSAENYDVIILDLNEATEEGPARMLFTSEFYSLVKSRLNPGGYCSIQSEWLHTDLHVNLTQTQKDAFEDVVVLDVSVPSFLLPEAINLAAKDEHVKNPDISEIDQFLNENTIDTRFYCGQTDLKIRTLSPDAAGRYEENIRIFTDTKPPAFEQSKVSEL